MTATRDAPAELAFYYEYRFINPDTFPWVDLKGKEWCFLDCWPNHAALTKIEPCGIVETNRIADELERGVRALEAQLCQAGSDEKARFLRGAVKLARDKTRDMTFGRMTLIRIKIGG